MNRQSLLAAMLSLACVATLAAETTADRLAYIRRCYAARIDKQSHQPLDDITVNRMTISYNEIVPAMGLCTVADTYYWVDDDDEYEPGKLNRRLYFVTSVHTLSHGAYRYSREYLFDEQTGEPLFLLVVTQMGDDTGTRREFRFYFDTDGKVMRQLPERIDPSGDDALPPDVEIGDNGRAIMLNADFVRVAATFRAILNTQ